MRGQQVPLCEAGSQEADGRCQEEGRRHAWCGPVCADAFIFEPPAGVPVITTANPLAGLTAKDAAEMTARALKLSADIGRRIFRGSKLWRGRHRAEALPVIV